MGDLQHLPIMRRDEHRKALPVHDLLDQFEDGACGNGIQLRRRLVGQNQGWPMHQRPSDGNPLLLPTRELVGPVTQTMR